MAREYVDAKEPPWYPILPPMPRISVSKNFRARLAHRRPSSLSSLPAAAVVDSSASPIFPKSVQNPSKSSTSQESTLRDAARDSQPAISSSSTSQNYIFSAPARVPTVSAPSLDAVSKAMDVDSDSEDDFSRNQSSMCSVSEVIPCTNSVERGGAVGSQLSVFLSISEIPCLPSALQQAASRHDDHRKGIPDKAVGFLLIAAVNGGSNETGGLADTGSDRISTVAASSSSPSLQGSEEVGHCSGAEAQVNQGNSPTVGSEAEVSDLSKTDVLLVEECELEEGQLPGEWSGVEESHEHSESVKETATGASVSAVVWQIPITPETRNVAHHCYYPYQAEEFHSEQRSRGYLKAKGKKKKKHKKGEGSRKRSQEKSSEKYNGFVIKRMTESKAIDDVSRQSGFGNRYGPEEQTGNSNPTDKFKVYEDVERIQLKKPAVDEGPEDGEIVLEPGRKSSNGVLSSLVESEVGLWTTDDVDDQFVTEMEQDGLEKKKRGPETAERKLKRKIAKRKRRAQRERELGIRRPPRTIQRDDCPYSHDLQAFPCKFFHTRGLCYDGENCQFSHEAISKEALAKLKQRVEKEKKEKISNTSTFDISIPAFSMALPAELDPDPLGWCTPSLHPNHEQRQYINPSILDQTTPFSEKVNSENHSNVPPPVCIISGQSTGFPTVVIDREDTRLDAASLVLLKGSLHSAMIPVCPSPPNERINAREVLEVSRMEEKLEAGQSLSDELVTCSDEANTLSGMRGPCALVPSMRAQIVMPLLRGRQLGSSVVDHEKCLKSPFQLVSKNQQTVESLLDEALRH